MSDDNEIQMPTADDVRDYQRRVNESTGFDVRDGAAALVERMMRLAEESARHRASLPCAPLFDAGKVAEAVDACVAAGAMKGCMYRRDVECCAVTREGMLQATVTQRLTESRALELEPKIARRILASVPGRRTPEWVGIPPKPLRDTDALAVVRAFRSGAQAVALSAGSIPLYGRMLVLAGPTDSGKTHAAVYALAHEGGLLVRATELESYDGPYERATRARFLVLDDVGEEHVGASGYASSQIAKLLCDRLNREAATIVTTNLARRSSAGQAPQFAERYGDRLDSRMREGATFVGVAQVGLREKDAS